MFFITNYENSIIAADKDFLETISVNDIFEAIKLFTEGKVEIDDSLESLRYKEKNLKYKRTSLNAFFGDAYLYRIDIEDSIIPETDLIGDLSTAVTKVTETADEDISADTDTSTELTDEELLSIISTDNDSEDTSNEPEDEISLLLTTEENKDDKELESDLIVDENSNEEISDEELLSLISDGEEEKKEETPDGEQEEELFALLTDNDTVEESVTKDETPSTENEDELFTLLTNDSIEKSEEVATTETTHDAEEPQDDELLLLLSEDEEKEEKPEVDDKPLTIEQADDELFTLTSNDDIEIEADSKLSDSVNEDSENKKSIDTAELSKIIGISENEYINFLDDFSAESKKLEDELKSPDLRMSREATNILKEASLLLRIPDISELLTELENATSSEKTDIISNFYKIVSQLHTNDLTDKPKILSTQDDITQLDISQPEEEETLNIIETMDTPVVQADTIEPIKVTPEEYIKDDLEESDISKEESTDENTSIAYNLDDIEAIPFDFSINEAAEELTLPSSLVTEFIMDFIDQAKENIPVLQKAYDERDLDKLQTTAHLLKGASSNLRVTPMADTLYQLQLNEDFDNVPELMRIFMGQLKTLDQHMNNS